MNWYNEPSKWAAHADTVTVQSEPKTDFWRLTRFRDNGHFYYQEQQGDFQAEVKFSGNYTATYDQAGLMVRVDEFNWIKCGIEFVNGMQHMSAVVTREYSDWSIVALAQNPAALWLRLSRRGTLIEIHFALDGTNYQLLRQAYFPPIESIQVGLMCASPEGMGFSITFEGFTVQSV